MPGTYDEKIMDFWDHLEELRWVILKSLIALGVGVGVGLAFTRFFFRLLLEPLRSEALRDTVELLYRGPLDAFLIKLKMAFLGGAVVAAPFVVIFAWSFVAPGLKQKERKAVYIGGGAGMLFFGVGIAFGYFMLSLILPLLAKFGEAGILHRWDLKQYIGFCVRLLLGVGIAFELPVILVILVRLGLIELRTLEKGRAYAVVIALIVSAILTPPDPITQLMLGVPLVLLYELSIIAARWQERWLRLHPDPELSEEEEEDEPDEDTATDTDSGDPDLPTSSTEPTNGGTPW